MKVPSAWEKTPFAVSRLIDIPEPSEEQEKVSWANAVSIEMGLGCSRLAEGRPPALLAGEQATVEIGIKMGTESRPHSTAGEVLDDFAQRSVSEIAVTHGTSGIRYRQRGNPSVRKDRTGTATGPRVESLPAQYNLQRFDLRIRSSTKGIRLPTGRSQRLPSFGFMAMECASRSHRQNSFWW